MRSSSGCCPRLGKPLGFQPVFACVSKSLEESLTKMRNSTLLCRRGLMGIALQARHPNENLENNLQLESFSVSSVCSVDYSVATLEILEEIFF